MATDAGKERTPEEGVEAAAVVLEEIHHARHPWPYQHALDQNRAKSSTDNVS